MCILTHAKEILALISVLMCFYRFFIRPINTDITSDKDVIINISIVFMCAFFVLLALA